MKNACIAMLIALVIPMLISAGQYDIKDNQMLIVGKIHNERTELYIPANRIEQFIQKYLFEDKAESVIKIETRNARIEKIQGSSEPIFMLVLNGTTHWRDKKEPFIFGITLKESKQQLVLSRTALIHQCNSKNCTECSFESFDGTIGCKCLSNTGRCNHKLRASGTAMHALLKGFFQEFE